MTLQCNGADCEQPANLQCPVCIEKKLNAIGYFCSQECFKKNWALHKLLHDSAKPSFNPWPYFKFTGNLRPYPTSQRRKVPASIEHPDYNPKTLEKAYNKIKVLDAQEIEGVKAAARIGRLVLDTAAKHIAVGVTTDEIDRIVHETCVSNGAYPSPLNYRGFPKSCCTSVNEIICHGIPDMRPLEDGDILNIDISVFYKGFHADLNETYCVGNVDEKYKKLIECSRLSLEAAIKAGILIVFIFEIYCSIVKPGVPYREIGAEIEKVTKEFGFSVVRTYCGHGIHRFFHAAPNVPHYYPNKAVGLIKAGHCFTIEPMINEGIIFVLLQRLTLILGTWKDVTWPDDWTSATADGKRSAQFEHMLLVTETGCEVLTR